MPRLSLIASEKIAPSAEDLAIESPEHELANARCQLPRKGRQYGELPLALLLAAVFSSVLAYWLALDHHIPNMDEAGHILNSYTFSELLKHIRPLKPLWWHQCLTVNSFYPPFIYIFNGGLRIFLEGRLADTASLLFFNFVFTLSVYGTARLLTASSLAAFAAAITINTYPALNQLSHSYLLDYPLAAMVSVALFALVFWQSSPSWTKTAMLGAALGLAFLSKQIGAAFLLGPASYYLIVHLKKDLEERNGFKTTRMLCTAGGIGIALFAPWLVYNSKALKEMGGYNIAHMGEQSFASNLTYYLQGVPHVMSPVLLALFLFSLAFMGRRYLKVITPALMSSIGGIIIISTISYTAPLDRYLTAGLVAPAIASGCLVAALWQKKHLPARLTAIALPSFALLQFVSFNFGQYPIASPQWLANLTQQSGVSLRGYRSSGGNAYDNPEPFKDWGHRWVIEQVDKYDRNIPVWVNILANSSAVNAHTYEFYAREMGKCMRPTTSRVWTMAGDTMTFSEESALYYKWYVIKSGRRGNIFKDKQSAEAEAKLIDFVTHSAKFEFKGRKPLPDGSSLSLYRQL